MLASPCLQATPLAQCAALALTFFVFVITLAFFTAAGACNGGDGSAGADTSVARLLVFNCMKERDPAVLLPALSSTLVARGAPLSHAVFVHPDSQYGSLNTTKPPGSSPPTVQLTAPVQQVTVEAAPTAPDYSWQLALQGVWESHCMKHGHGTKVPGGSGGILPMPVVPGEICSSF